MKLLKDDIVNVVNENDIKKWFLNLKPEKRKIYLKYFSNKGKFQKLYKNLIKTKIYKIFYLKKYANSVQFTNNYLDNLYIICSFSKYNIDGYKFYDFWGLNKEERKYLDEMFYVEDDFLERKNYKSLIKGIYKHYYSEEKVFKYMNIKYKNVQNTKIYWDVRNCLESIKLNNLWDLFNPKYHNYENEHKYDQLLEQAIKFKFNLSVVNELKGQL